MSAMIRIHKRWDLKNVFCENLKSILNLNAGICYVILFVSWIFKNDYTNIKEMVTFSDHFFENLLIDIKQYEIFDLLNNLIHHKKSSDLVNKIKIRRRKILIFRFF